MHSYTLFIISLKRTLIATRKYALMYISTKASLSFKNIDWVLI